MTAAYQSVAALIPWGSKGGAKTTFDAISKTYSYLTPDLWNNTKSRYKELTNYLIKPLPIVSFQKI